jgi:WD40 repeat protein
MHSCEVTAVDMAANGALVVSGGADGRVVVWSATSGFRMAVFTLHSKVIRSVKFDAGEALAAEAEAQGQGFWCSGRVCNSGAITVSYLVLLLSLQHHAYSSQIKPPGGPVNCQHSEAAPPN